VIHLPPSPPREEAVTPDARRSPPGGSVDELLRLRARVEQLEREVRLKVSALVDREREVESLYARVATQAREIQQLKARR